MVVSRLIENGSMSGSYHRQYLIFQPKLNSSIIQFHAKVCYFIGKNGSKYPIHFFAKNQAGLILICILLDNLLYSCYVGINMSISMCPKSGAANSYW